MKPEGSVFVRGWALLALGLSLLVPGTATQAQPSEFSSCFEEGSYCSESPLDTLIVDSCGALFRQFVGRVAFPPLVNRGPVTIRIRTVSIPLTPFPLYVEIRGHTPSEPTSCTTLLAGDVVLVGQGIVRQCGGTWESVGPLDLTLSGVLPGGLYHVQLVGFVNPDNGYGTVGVACVELSSPTSLVQTVNWQRVKQLYKEQ